MVEDMSNDNNNDWMSLREGLEFQPNRQLQRAVNGHETYYDEYAQAWRLLGFYIDCNSNNNQQQRRELAENNNNGCQRYLLWAAYVDLNYSGGGLGEYQIYHPDKGWQKDACEATADDESSKRCVKMDCHQSHSHYQLLGYYKETEYDDFFEQLFKHQGYCIWSNQEYQFMDTWRASWPQGCTQLNGNYYYDLKPLAGGRMGVGVYTDAYCVEEYHGHNINLSQIFQACGDGDDGCQSLSMSVDAFVQKFNDLLDIYRTCLPCKAFDLSVTSRNNNDHDNHNNNDNYDPNGGLFQCDDDAGYTNVNQCMKFATQTEMLPAAPDLVRQAAQQGTLQPTPPLSLSRVRLAHRQNGFLVFSLIFLVLATLFFGWASRRARRHRRTGGARVEPLLIQTA